MCTPKGLFYYLIRIKFIQKKLRFWRIKRLDIYL